MRDRDKLELAILLTEGKRLIASVERCVDGGFGWSPVVHHEEVVYRGRALGSKREALSVSRRLLRASNDLIPVVVEDLHAYDELLDLGREDLCCDFILSLRNGLSRVGGVV